MEHPTAVTRLLFRRWGKIVKQRVSSDSPLEPSIDFCRVIRAGSQIIVPADIATFEQVGSTTTCCVAAHSKWLGVARAATPTLLVSGFIRPEWKVEIDTEANSV